MPLLQNQFIVDDVSKIIKEAIENTIGGNAYQHDKGNISSFHNFLNNFLINKVPFFSYS